ncbi:EscU/YscU/HrcU family type III secretion system export apparatus switch protein [Derxia gummosa]|uniref:EscU/YscU/HrcU family type III secretion system export apparatus switch protein n=1 Tax=Derxia gummosa DSM 723 TaxID=1121388 RepID=A0A8B6XBX6_9BURK|nr:EscU/YscU/HrcU family type III secretion system export apparatus switch protein [Derxia gummosa]
MTRRPDAPAPSQPAAPPLAATLAYDPQRDAAPRVTARGRGAIAEEILRRADEAGVPRVHSEALAAALVRMDIDMQIPPELYLAVAEILAWVARLDEEAAR